MKRPVIHTALVAGFLWLGCVAQGIAQQQKIGYVDTDYILSQMSEYENVQQKLQALSSQWNRELEQMEEEINRLKKEFQAQKVLYTDEQKAQKQQQIQSKIAQRQQYLDEKFGAKGAYFQQQKTLLEPIQRTVFKAINTVAKRQGFDFVFDRAQNSALLFGNAQFNLNEEVLQELGVTLNESRNE